VEVKAVPAKKVETTEEKQAFLDDLNGVTKVADTTQMSAKERLAFLRNKNKSAA
jgi:hypothetical protein